MASAVACKEMAQPGQTVSADPDASQSSAMEGIAHLAARICRAPTAAICVADRRKPVVAALVGMSRVKADTSAVGYATSVSRAVLASRMPVVVEDLSADWRFAFGAGAVRALVGRRLETPSGTVLGTLCVFDTNPRSWSPEDLEAVDILARQAAALIKIGHAKGDAANARQRQRALETQWMAGRSEERRCLAIELHDGLGQELAGISMIVSAAARRCRDEKTREDLVSVGQMLAGALQDCRRLMHGKASFASVRGNLRERLQRYSQTVDETSSIRCVFECVDAIAPTDHVTCDHLTRLAQEAMLNAVRHSGGSCVWVQILQTDTHLELQVTDDGRGLGCGARDPDGVGIESMRSHAREMGAHLEFIEREPHGLKVRCRLPLHRDPVEWSSASSQRPIIHG